MIPIHNASQSLGVGMAEWFTGVAFNHLLLKSVDLGSNPYNDIRCVRSMDVKLAAEKGYTIFHIFDLLTLPLCCIVQ